MTKQFWSRTAFIVVIAGLTILGALLVVKVISDRTVRSESDQRARIERQTSTTAAKAIVPELVRYADIVDGKIRLSPRGRKKDADELRRLAGLAKDQGVRLDSLNLIYKTGVCWTELAAHLASDAEILESTLPQMGPYLRTSSVQLNRKIAVVFQKHADQGFVNSAYLASDLDDGDYFRMNIVSHGSSYFSASSSHTDFIKETSDLPSSAQYALDKIYKADAARAWELSRQAHEVGVQNLPNQ